MSWQGLDLEWSDAEVNASDLWARSGGAWLTEPAVGVPVGLMRGVAGIARFLDRRGAGLAGLVGAEGVGVIGERAASLGLAPSGTVDGCASSCGGASRILRCADGWIAVTLARDDDLAMIPAWLGVDVSGLHWPIVEAEFANRSSLELVERAALLGLACARVGEVAATSPVLARHLGRADPLALQGLVVANLSSLWAGPLASDLLARMGARVITIESEQRPDGTRRIARFFDALHGRSESVALPLHTEPGRRQLHEVLSCADVVIEGSRPRALEQMGIDAASVVREHAQIWVSITAYGRDAYAGQRVGFGDDTAAAGGLVGWVDDAPYFLADAVADPITGLTVAGVVAQLVGTGDRWLVDVALSRVAASMSGRSGSSTRADQPILAPRVRTDPGGQMPLGRDTRSVLTGFGIDRPA